VNPSDIQGGKLDSDQIGPWSLWQGNLSASLMVVGQDWGDTGYFERHGGREGPQNPTNEFLVELVGIAGVSIEPPDSDEGRDVAFFSNSILCLKNADGGLQGEVTRSWFENCAPVLRRQIEIVAPRVLVALGERAFGAIMKAYGMKAESFREEVETLDGRLLLNGSRAFAVYHCGARIRNTHRPMEQQRQDWKRIRPHLVVG
jgi:DNA polymerase